MVNNNQTLRQVFEYVYTATHKPKKIKTATEVIKTLTKRYNQRVENNNTIINDSVVSTYTIDGKKFIVATKTSDLESSDKRVKEIKQAMVNKKSELANDFLAKEIKRINTSIDKQRQQKELMISQLEKSI